MTLETIPPDVAQNAIQRTVEMLRKGQTEESIFIRLGLSIGAFDEVLDMARARIKNIKFPNEGLFMTQDDLCFATPLSVGD